MAGVKVRRKQRGVLFASFGGLWQLAGIKPASPRLLSPLMPDG